VRRALLFLLAMAVADVVRAGDEPFPYTPRSLGITGGLFEFTDDTYREGEFGLQYRLSRRWGPFQPIGGGMVTTAGAFNLYAGVGIDFPAGRRWLFRASFAPGYYDKGPSGKDLGLALEFRSSLEIAWRLSSGWRFGIEIYHLSNADMGRINPGDGSLLLTVTVPLERWPRPTL
jgi:lipid A 3-O-deacylase